ncbi:MAG: ribbon-helix-helix domain-containing protein [Spirochaetaceae bacterium]|jgi:hypothetical protein|nr:ribbon-helix-helix domain-containing protein [Spirochaetaceae bacterium]
MTTARLPDELEKRLEVASRAQHTAKSYMVKEALVRYLDLVEDEKTSYQLGLPYFGKYGSGGGDLSVTYKKRLREKIGDKYRTH